VRFTTTRFRPRRFHQPLDARNTNSQRLQARSTNPIRPRADVCSTGVRRVFDCLLKVIKCTIEIKLKTKLITFLYSAILSLTSETLGTCERLVQGCCTAMRWPGVIASPAPLHYRATRDVTRAADPLAAVTLTYFFN